MGGGAIQLQLGLGRKTGVPKDDIFAKGFLIVFSAFSSHLSLRLQDPAKLFPRSGSYQHASPLDRALNHCGCFTFAAVSFSLCDTQRVDHKEALPPLKTSAQLLKSV